MLIAAATEEFATRGLYGTSTDDIARRAGISQPYLFRLFRTKKELFIAAIERCFDMTTEVFRGAAESAPMGERLHQMGLAYCRLLQNRPMLMMQMQAYAACEDEDVRDVVRRRYGELFRFIEEESGASREDVRAFFSTGMLLNVAAATTMHVTREPWAERLLGDMLDIG